MRRGNGFNGGLYGQNAQRGSKLRFESGDRTELPEAFAESNGIKTVTEEEIEKRLYTAGLPDIDLVIRTSGEMRLSNFFLWQCAYAEFYFTDVLWPDFHANDLDEALEWYSGRKRRFGGVGTSENKG